MIFLHWVQNLSRNTPGVVCLSLVVPLSQSPKGMCCDIGVFVRVRRDGEEGTQFQNGSIQATSVSVEWGGAVKRRQARSVRP